MEEKVKKALRILEKVEMYSGVFEITVNDVPIWWFLRWRFHHTLLSKLCEGDKNASVYVAFSKVPKGQSKLKKVNFKVYFISLFRSCLSLLRLFFKWRVFKNKTLFITDPIYLYKDADGNRMDKILDIGEKKLRNQIVQTEKMSFTNRDLDSLLYRKDTIFLDWIALYSIIKYFIKRKKYRVVRNWDKFETNCLEMDFDGIPSEWIIESLKDVLKSMKSQIFVLLNNAEVIFKVFEPKNIILMDAYSNYAIAVIYYAKEFGIPVMEMQHGLINDYHIGYKIRVPTGFKGKLIIADKVILYGDKYKEIMLSGENIHKKENLIVAGSPLTNKYINKYFQKKAYMRKRMRERITINKDSFVVMITSGYSNNYDLLEFIKEIIKIPDDFYLVIKPHPLEYNVGNSIYKTIESHPRVRVIKKEESDLFENLAATDVHASINSSVFLECLPLQIPNIIIKISTYFEIFLLLKKDEVINVSTPEEFVKEVRKLRKQPGYLEKFRELGFKEGKRFFHGYWDNGYSAKDKILEEAGIKMS